MKKKNKKINFNCIVLNLIWKIENFACVFFFKSPAPPNTCGKLLISGATNWDLVGRKETPKSAGKFVFHETLILVNRLSRGLRQCLNHECYTKCSE